MHVWGWKGEKIIYWRFICQIHLSNPRCLRTPEPTGRHEDHLSRTSVDRFRCRELPEKKLRLNCVERPPPKKSTESLPNKILGTLGVKIWMVQPFLSTTLVLLTLAFSQLKRYVCKLQRLEQVKCTFSHYFTLTVIVLCRKISTSSPEDFLV